MDETNQQIVHEIWRPTNNEGVDGKKIAVVGYSHYHDEHQGDRPSLTRDIVQNVIDGAEKHPFFTEIRNAFGYESHKDFWSRVYFFNFLPRSVGTPDKKYLSGSETEIREAKTRFLNFLEEEQPDQVFVFTRKGWAQFPEETEQEKSGGVCTPLMEGSKSNWGTYVSNGKAIRVCGLTHPQYADAKQLRHEVRLFLGAASPKRQSKLVATLPKTFVGQHGTKRAIVLRPTKAEVSFGEFSISRAGIEYRDLKGYKKRKSWRVLEKYFSKQKPI